MLPDHFPALGFIRTSAYFKSWVDQPWKTASSVHVHTALGKKDVSKRKGNNHISKLYWMLYWLYVDNHNCPFLNTRYWVLCITIRITGKYLAWGLFGIPAGSVNARSSCRSWSFIFLTSYGLKELKIPHLLHSYI